METEAVLSAMEQVVATPELFDYIISFILSDLHQLTDQEEPRSVRTHANANLLTSILKLSQVSRIWNQAILGTKYLRRSLFLTHDATAPRSWDIPNENETANYGYWRKPSKQAPILNPIIQTTFPSYNLRFSWKLKSPKHCASLRITRRDLEYLTQRDDTGEGKTISNMLLSQPACTSLAAEVWEFGDQARGNNILMEDLEDGFIQAEDGVTLGLVHEKVRELFGRYGDLDSVQVTTE